MCGIVGYVGRSQAAPILLDGLRRLEYRGYDSAGVAIVNGDHVETRKCAGRIASLAKPIRQERAAASKGRTHTRWARPGKATTGKPTRHLAATATSPPFPTGEITNSPNSKSH